MSSPARSPLPSRRLGIRKLVGGIILAFTIRLWAAGFAISGRLLRPSLTFRKPGGVDRVLVIAPHPDDETLGCGGAIAAHAAAGDEVTVLVVTDGGSSRAGGRTRAEIRALREAEVRAAVAELGAVNLLHLALPEGRWAPSSLAGPLASLISEQRPTIIYSPSTIDFHPEHIKVSQVLGRILVSSGQAATASVRVYELQVPLTPLLANTALKVSCVQAEKERALSRYRTQLQSFGWLPRHTNYLQQLYHLDEPIEVFWEMTPQQFAELTLRCRPVRNPFRSMRPRPFTDPLAWLYGLLERRRLRQCVSSVGTYHLEKNVVPNHVERRPPGKPSVQDR